MKSIITSHFVAVFPIYLKNGEFTTTLVLYKNRYKTREPLEYRLIGGTSEGDELPWQTAVREMRQEAGLIAQDASIHGFLQVGEPEEHLNETEEGLHLKYCFVCIDPIHESTEQIHEVDVEGTLDVSIERVIAHIAREFPLPGAHSIRNRFHRKSIRASVQGISAGLPKLAEISAKYGW